MYIFINNRQFVWYIIVIWTHFGILTVTLHVVVFFYQVRYLYSYIRLHFIKTSQSGPLWKYSYTSDFCWRRTETRITLVCKYPKESGVAIATINVSLSVFTAIHWENAVFRSWWTRKHLLKWQDVVVFFRIGTSKIQNIFKKHLLAFAFCDYRVIILVSQHNCRTILFQSCDKFYIPLLLFSWASCDYVVLRQVFAHHFLWIMWKVFTWWLINLNRSEFLNHFIFFTLKSSTRYHKCYDLVLIIRL